MEKPQKFKQFMQVERITIDRVEGFLLTIDGVKSAESDKCALLGKITEAIMGGVASNPTCNNGRNKIKIGNTVCDMKDLPKDFQERILSELGEHSTEVEPPEIELKAAEPTKATHLDKNLLWIPATSFNLQSEGVIIIEFGKTTIYKLDDVLRIKRKWYTGYVLLTIDQLKYLKSFYIESLSTERAHELNTILNTLVGTDLGGKGQRALLRAVMIDLQKNPNALDTTPSKKALPLPCPVCGSDDVVPHGSTETQIGTTYKRICKNCGVRYTDKIGYGFNKKFSNEIVDEALQLKGKMSTYKIAKHIEQNYGKKVSHQTILLWQKYKEKILKFRKEGASNKPTEELKITIPTPVEPISCPVCGSNNTVAHGSRETKGSIKFRRKCKDCGASYTDQDVSEAGKRFPKEIVEEAIRLKGELSLRKIAEHIEQKYGTKINHATILRWYHQDKGTVREIEGRKLIHNEVKHPNECNKQGERDNKPLCPICQTNNTGKSGFDPDKVQRTWCFTCKRTFRADVGGKAPEGTKCPLCGSEDCISWRRQGCRYGSKSKYLCRGCKKFFSVGHFMKSEKVIPEVAEKVESKPPEQAASVEHAIKEATQAEPAIVESKPTEQAQPTKATEEPAESLSEAHRKIITMAKDSIDITGKVNFDKIKKESGLDIGTVTEVLTKNWGEIKRAMDKHEDSKYEAKVHTDTRVVGKDNGDSDVGII